MMISEIDTDRMGSPRVFYPDSKQAPYLRSPDSDTGVGGREQSAESKRNDTPRSGNASGTTPLQSSQQEADAAAGGGSSFGRRVSSFSLLPRVASMDTVNRASLLQQQQQHIYANPNAPSIERDAKDGAHGAQSQRPNTDMSQESAKRQVVKPDWRLKDRMKTVGVGLVLALNVGTDPPDLTKPHPCAVLECWIDPRSVSRNKAKEIIGERLEQQYAKWQLARTGRPLKYKRALDPTVEDVRALCLQLRRQARNERILLHYNGHGVPRPTANGEIWVFDKNHTEYIPLSIVDLRQWMGKPSIVVLDCSAAGILIPSFQTRLGAANDPANASREPDMDIMGSQSHWVNDTIVLCPCSENQWLPMSPDYPADIFTSCLTTPIPIALRWFVRNHPSSMSGIHPDSVDSVPGKANDRRTPLGELNWIFTAVTDSIAWNALPKPLFQRLFRQDLLVASMFRNFLLADRILRSLGCTPMSYPPLPPGLADHPLWRAWDLACETLLFQLMQDGILVNKTVVPPNQQHTNNDEDGGVDDEGEATSAAVQGSSTTQTQAMETTNVRTNAADALNCSVSSPFFSEQLSGFEVWLDFSPIHEMQLANGISLESPEQLPVVLQVLLSQTHRIRALTLLRRFLDLGPWAVNLSLSLGIFPYVMKLLQSPEYKSLLISIWASILAFDPTCRVDLLKDGAFHHFVQHLLLGMNNGSLGVSVIGLSAVNAGAAKERTMAAFVLAAASHEYPAGQAECIRLNLHGTCCALLSSYEQGKNKNDENVDIHLPAHFRLWLCMCLANMVKDNTHAQNEAYRAGVHTRLLERISDSDPGVRAAVCYALGCLIGSQTSSTSRTPSTQELSSMQQHQVANQGVVCPPGLMPQRMINQPNLMVGGTMSAGSAVQIQLQASLNPTTAGMPNLHWRPQHLEPAQAIGSHIPNHAGAQFLSQHVQLRPAQAQYMMHGQTMNPQSTLNVGTPGFLLPDANPVVGAVQSQLLPHHFQQQQLPSDVPKQAKPSVFEDRQRLDLDLMVTKAVLTATQDASVMVRYEATLALSNTVSKYLDAFDVVAEESAINKAYTSQSSEQKLPQGLNRALLAPFAEVWKSLRWLQHDDPFPAIAKVSSRIVSFVHERLLQSRMDSNDLGDRKPEEMQSKKLARFLAGIDEEIPSASRLFQPGTMPSTPPRISHEEERRIQSSGRVNRKPELRRALSESVTGTDGVTSMEQNARLNPRAPEKSDTPMKFTLPTSEYYVWKKTSFDTNFRAVEGDGDEDDDEELDLMSPAGAAKAYQSQRNSEVRTQAYDIAERYSLLAPKAPKPATKSIQMLLEEEDEEALEAAEEQASAKKRELKLKQTRVLRDEGVKMTSMVRFHPFENVIVSCGATHGLSLWDTENGKRILTFSNGNPEGSRMTTSCWMNEESSSLFCVGCNDGTVRIWGDFLESNGEPSGRQPSLVSAFYALPMEAGKRGSGLICEWQQFSGVLLAGGNAAVINCWDLEAECKICQIETNTEANVTTLTTAWDFDQLGMGSVPQGYQGIGRDIVVSGHSDGTLKVFDLRTHSQGIELREKSQQHQRLRRRPTGYSEHKSWVVATAFSGYSNRYELISGTLTGEIKAWDLRMSSSIRTIEAQRSTMTALSVHSKIPIAATGSHAQFIKVLTLDGDTLQVLRYHERMSSRIGPVSCLDFHRYKPILAAGSTDEFIGLYTPKMRV